MRPVFTKNNLLTGFLILALIYVILEVDEQRLPINILHVKNADSAIESIDTELDNNAVYLNVHITQYISCKDAIEELGIQTIVVEDKAYIPKCKYVNEKLLRITYTDAITT